MHDHRHHLGRRLALASFSCDVPAGTSTTGLNRGDLANGQSKTVFLRFETPDQSAPLGDVFNNRAVVSASEPDSDLANNTETEPTTTRQRVDLRTTKTSSAASVSLNEPFSWTVTVVNNGPGNSLRTDLTDTLPVGAALTGPVTFTRSAPALPGGGTCTVVARVVTCGLGPARCRRHRGDHAAGPLHQLSERGHCGQHRHRRHRSRQDRRHRHARRQQHRHQHDDGEPGPR